MNSLLDAIVFQIRLAGARIMRLGRLVVFGFELIILSRLMERHRDMARAVTSALLKTKNIDIEPPELSVTRDGEPVQSWSHGFTAMYAALFLNLRNPDGLSRSRHAQPAPSFRAIYLWDSAFIAQVWKWWDPRVAWDVANSVVQLRDRDRLQHFVSDMGGSKFTQPPLIAWSIARLADNVSAEQFRDWALSAYEPLRAYHDWLRTHRSLPNGLYAWAHPYESGVENAPRFSTRDERRFLDTRHLAAPDLSSYVVLQAEALALMASAIGRANEAAEYERSAALLRATINATLWDEEEGLYFDRDIRDGRFIRSRTIASLMPLWAGAPDAARARRLEQQVLNPATFNTLMPLPSVALNDADFEKDMWRGPVWLNTAFAVIEGLRRYGFDAAASDMVFRLCDGVYRTFDETGHFYEFYDPTAHGISRLHRKRGNRWKKLTLGSGPVVDFVGWTGLANTMVIETLFGLKRGPRGLSIQPQFPERAKGLTFTLTLPADEAEVELEVGADGAVRGETRLGGEISAFEAAFGEVVPITHASAQRIASGAFA